MEFEETGLPDNKTYRKAFSKGYKAMTRRMRPETVGEKLKIRAYNTKHVSSSKFICSLNLPPELEKKLVVTVLAGHSIFNIAVNKELRRLEYAWYIGNNAHETTAFFKEATQDMNASERLLVQLGIFSSLKLLADHAEKTYQKLSSGEAALAFSAAFKNTQAFQDIYDVVSKAEYPALDNMMVKARARLKAPAPLSSKSQPHL